MIPSLSRATALLGTALLFAATPAWTSNFPYTFVSVQIGQAVLDDPFYLGGDEYKDFKEVGAGASYQLWDYVAAGFNLNSRFGEEANSETSAETKAPYLAFPIPVGSRVDLVPHVGYRETDFETCVSGNCVRNDNEGATYGALVRTWLEPGKLEFKASWLDADIENFDSEKSAGLGVWVNRNNRLGLEYTDQSASSVIALSYRYNW